MFKATKTIMTDTVEEEIRLAEQMKNLYCDESGKETNPAKAAEIIHRIGQIYRNRSPDKISLIKSAGLFNAAIVRKPSNIVKVKTDLNEACQHILQQANANKQNEDLIKKAEEVKTSINKLRKNVQEFLEKSLPQIPNNTKRKKFQQLMTKKISAIKQINKDISVCYRRIMADLSKFCEDVMGKPPCEYAIAALGSLAREEITPYSDFEHIILLFDENKCYTSHLNYFRWYSVIFHVVILNVQETIIPSLNVCCLNDENYKLGNWYYDAITTRGISFDGMMPHACKFPLGRLQHTKSKPFTTELIKPVSEMLKYLSFETDLKNGYHLADILTKTCFVFGNGNIFQQFLDGATTYRNEKSQTDIVNDIQQQVKDDLNNFSTRFRLSNLNTQHTINIKQLVYRSTTIFIAALARLYNISANSCFDIICQIAKINKLTKKAAYKLKCAIAIACEMRLRVYMQKQSQSDDAIDLKQDGIDYFLNIVGKAATINYFQIAYCLQCEIAKQLNFTKLHFYADPHLINITIGVAFGNIDLVSFSENPQKQFWDSSEFEFDEIIDQVEREIDLYPISFEDKAVESFRNFELSINKIKTIADYLRDVKIYDEAVEFYKQLSDMYNRKLNDKDHDFDLALVNKNIGFCLNVSHRPQEALSYFNQALLTEFSFTIDAERDRAVAASYLDLGQCHYNLQNWDDALVNFNRAHKVFQDTTLNADKDSDIALTLLNIGRLHMTLKNYHNALTYLTLALNINQNTTLNADIDENIASTLHSISFCQSNLLNYDDALTNLSLALKIFQNATLNAEKEKNIAVILYEIGRCYISLHGYNDALTHLYQALEIEQNTTLNPENDTDISATLYEIGRCHIGLHNYDFALTYLNQTLEIEQNTTLNAEKDWSIGLTLYNIGHCHIDLHNCEEALSCLNRALKIEENTTISSKKDRIIAVTLNEIGRCHIEMHNYDDALTYLNRALEIEKNASLEVDMNRDLSITQCNIGRCRTELQQFDESWNCFERSLKLLRSTTRDEQKDCQFANIFNYIGEYFIKKKNFSVAVTYLHRAIIIYQTSNTNTQKNIRLAKTLHSIGTSSLQLQDHSNALNYFRQSLQIYKSVYQNEDVFYKIASLRLSIDECFTKLS